VLPSRVVHSSRRSLCFIAETFSKIESTNSGVVLSKEIVQLKVEVKDSLKAKRSR